MKFSTITEENYPDVKNIYLEGIETGLATFETSAPSWEIWNQDHLPFGRVLLTESGKSIAWGSLAPVSGRCVYGGVAEISVYVAANERGRGLGKIVLNELVRQSEENGIWTVQSGIMTGNVASIKIHESCGFREIGYRERVSQINGVWMDNLMMERRSKIVGI